MNDAIDALFEAHELVGTVMHLVRLEHEVVDGNLNATDEVVRRKLVPVPKLNGQLFGSADLIGRDEDERSLLPDRAEVLGDDTGRVELRRTTTSASCLRRREDRNSKRTNRLSELAVSDDDVRVALAVVVLS